MEYLTKKIDDKIIQELAQFDHEMVEIAGAKMKASECFRFSTDPVHLLFNTNCPESLKDKITAIVRKYHPGYVSAEQTAVRETREYQLVAAALINGKLLQKNLDSISGTEEFSESYLQDLASQALRDEFPEQKFRYNP